MANATVGKTTETIEVEVERVNLSLTRAEAESLHIITGHIGGPPEEPIDGAPSRRAHFDRIRKALADAGVRVPSSVGDRAGHGSFHFHPDERWDAALDNA